jgi:hypothetical protein
MQEEWCLFPCSGTRNVTWRGDAQTSLTADWRGLVTKEILYYFYEIVIMQLRGTRFCLIIWLYIWPRNSYVKPLLNTVDIQILISYTHATPSYFIPFSTAASIRRILLLSFTHKMNRLLYPCYMFRPLSSFFLVAHQPNSDLGRVTLAVSRSPTIRHTTGLAPLNEWSASLTGRYLHDTQQTTQMKIQALLAGFEPTIPAINRPQAYILDFMATVIGPK